MNKKFNQQTVSSRPKDAPFKVNPSAYSVYIFIHSIIAIYSFTHPQEPLAMKTTLDKSNTRGQQEKGTMQHFDHQILCRVGAPFWFFPDSTYLKLVFYILQLQLR